MTDQSSILSYINKKTALQSRKRQKTKTKKTDKTRNRTIKRNPVSTIKSLNSGCYGGTDKYSIWASKTIILPSSAFPALYCDFYGLFIGISIDHWVSRMLFIYLIIKNIFFLWQLLIELLVTAKVLV